MFFNISLQGGSPQPHLQQLLREQYAWTSIALSSVRTSNMCAYKKDPKIVGNPCACDTRAAAAVPMCLPEEMPG